MIKQFIFISISALYFFSSSCIAQDTLIYEIPFSLDKKLLVFKGKLNGVETDFAFDTGAGEGIATTKDEERKAVKRTSGSQSILDGNGKKIALQTVITEKLSIGGFTFENVRASINDMQYLYCMDLYLLGADIIKKLNWEIDFEKMVLKVSKNRFPTSINMTVIPVTFEYSIPRTQLTLEGVVFKNVLIDIGFTGSMTFPISNKIIQKLLVTKRELGLVTSHMASTFAAAGMSKTALTESIVIDSFKINNFQYEKIDADFKSNTDFKIGISFFSSTCKKLIINNSQKKYYLQLKERNTLKSKFPLSVLLTEGKLRISFLTISNNLVNKTFFINEEIKSLNGKVASDFVDECDFLQWFYLNRWDFFVIQKSNGETITVPRISNQ